MLPEDANADKLVDRAAEHGLIPTPGTSFFVDPDDERPTEGRCFVRLPFRAVMPPQINEGVRRLAGLL
jgi:DNA-binding transcriptional MocR family regulator